MSKQMPNDALKTANRTFLEPRKVLVLCTCSENIPRATPMDFYINKKEKEDFTLYVAPAPGRKVKNIKKNPMVSIGIYTPMDTGKIQGMQITASGSDRLIFLAKGDEGFDSAQKIVRGRRKLILKILPERIELLDYDFIQQGFSRHQTLELP
ncbi:MAG: pyridoxamine 5'-phosphate oxidase family protein [Promethearchaeia archaeon]